MKVLLPVEGSLDAKFIIDFISNYRWLRGTQFRLLHVVSLPGKRSDAKKAIRQSREMLGELTEKVLRFLPDTSVEDHLKTGSPVAEIVRQARDWEANMIVMGFRTRYTVQEQLAGSVSRGVSLQAPCSVVVIRPPIINNKSDGFLLPSEDRANKLHQA